MKTLGLLLVAFTACTGELTPEGPHHKYVVSGVRFPANASEAQELALAFDEGENPVNAFGAAIAGAIPLQTTTNFAITHGEDSLLLDLQARAFDDAIAAGVQVAIGGLPQPPACSGPETCGRHLTGSGSFSRAQSGDALFGSIRGGTFLSESGTVTIQLSFDGLRQLEMILYAARVQLVGVTDTRITSGIIAGAVTRAFLETTFIDELTTGATLVLIRDCSGACSCLGGSPGAALLVAFDPNHDCSIDRAEITGSAPIQALMRADLEINGIPAVSFGMGIAAVSASFDED